MQKGRGNPSLSAGARNTLSERKDTFSRLVCFPGGEQEPARLFLEEFSGTPGVPGKYGWTSSVPLWDAETILRGWLRGEVPSTAGWVLMERTDHGWQQALERR